MSRERVSMSMGECLIVLCFLNFNIFFLDPVGFSRRLRAKTHKWYSKQERKRWKNFKKAFKKKKYNLKKLKRKKSKRKMSKRRGWMFPS